MPCPAPEAPARRLAPALALSLLAVWLSLGAGPVGVERTVTFRADDGVLLSAEWHDPSFRPGPAVILVHMLNRSHQDWQAVAPRLAAAGIGALALDLRGHGESLGSRPAGGEYEVMVADVLAARRFLATRGDVRPGRVGIAGASLGANLAALAAARDESIGSLALLSPSLDYRGLRIDAPLRSVTRPILLVAGDDDPYALRSARDLQKAAPSSRELLVSPRAGHGTLMLGRDPGLPAALVDWFRRTLL